jgi:hypothetical protein
MKGGGFEIQNAKTRQKQSAKIMVRFDDKGKALFTTDESV